MTISMLHSTVKMTATITGTEPAPHSKNVHLRVAQAWQNNPVEKMPATEKNRPPAELQFSAIEQSVIENFIESMRTTQDKKALFALLNKKLRSLSSAERVKFLTGLETTIKKSALPEDQILLKEKFNPAYAMYVATDMLINQLNQELLAKIGRVPDDDEEPDEI